MEGDKRFVTIEGYVKKPGKYELYQNNMRINDIIFRAAGLDDPIFRRNMFLERADLIRFNNEDRINQIIIPFNISEILNNRDHPSNKLLKPGDVIRIYSKFVFNQVRSVFISGSINKPGTYNYKLNMTLRDLILEAGGVAENLYRYRVEIARVDPKVVNDDIYAENFVFEMNNEYLVNSEKNNDLNDSISDFMLYPYDMVSIRPDPFFDMQKTVSLIGEVNFPGDYALLNSNETIFDIVERAGGVKTNAFNEGSRFIRKGNSINIDIKKILSKSNSKHDILLQGGDTIFIAFKPNMIEILGEVNVPGFYKFVKGYRINDVLDISGGLTVDANNDDIFIRYANGLSKKYDRWLSNPKIKDGSKIYVGKNPEEEPFDRTEYLKELTSIVANLAQVLSLVLLAR